MKITVLVENNTVSEALEHRHGLSLYIETERHKLLFDVGPDDSFIRNAEKLGIDIAAVDAVVISHGHYDHGGGLAAFFAANSTAPVYIRSSGFIPCWSDTGRYIGLDKELEGCDRFVFTGEDYIIDEELRLVSGIRERVCFPSSNVTLLVEKNGERVLDDFEHEQVLVITEGEQT
ncbi:MAG: MBL fold metallo-hydrolase, partial [Oscillospiraceae bacterium]|nr:MBL fold metallo-hydrolase [Oscillospiraceae bacterium]